ncbi:transducin-like enhancer protein 2a isoform X1 [Lates japonicus]|uniref:Transducin-like enhancer protein 2a isoform X1 n=1 Tax=Lates japonicus TaxID=270547 RepID=A0AAD3MAI2_LATJO|nr:transducin-like enhancer protein 2a isoform X1 [Lates japonicus]
MFGGGGHHHDNTVALSSCHSSPTLGRGVILNPIQKPREIGESYYTSSAVRCGVGDITQNKGVLEARNERAETSFAITFETGPNASLRPTIVYRLLVFLDEAFRPEREKEEGQKSHTGDAQVGGYNVSSKPTTGTSAATPWVIGLSGGSRGSSSRGGIGDSPVTETYLPRNFGPH